MTAFTSLALGVLTAENLRIQQLGILTLKNTRREASCKWGTKANEET